VNTTVRANGTLPSCRPVRKLLADFYGGGAGLSVWKLQAMMIPFQSKTGREELRCFIFSKKMKMKMMMKMMIDDD